MDSLQQTDTIMDGQMEKCEGAFPSSEHQLRSQSPAIEHISKTQRFDKISTELASDTAVVLSRNDELTGFNSVCTETSTRRSAYPAVKRLFDVVFSLTILLVTFPIMLVAALLVKLTSPGPIVFKQLRVGRDQKLFWCYKLRSMCVDAEAKKAELMHLNEAEGPVFKIKQDPRVTPVGAILRKLSIDELPQLFNILRGDMSVVGPRPPLPDEVAKYTDWQLGRLAVRPGLTCLWQVSGRSNVSFERWMELDILYIETMSFSNDIKIILRTIPAVFTGSGAH